MLQTGRGNRAMLVRNHENIAVGAVGGTQAAADAVILDHDLEVFAAMD